MNYLIKCINCLQIHRELPLFKRTLIKNKMIVQPSVPNVDGGNGEQDQRSSPSNIKKMKLFISNENVKQ